MLRVTQHTASVEGVVQATYRCPACGHRAGVITESRGSGAAHTMYLFHDLAQEASRERALGTD